MLELYSCAASGGKFIVAMTPSERDRFAQEILVDPGAFFRMLSKISTKNAQCSRMEDRVSSHVLFTTVAMMSTVVAVSVGLASVAMIFVNQPLLLIIVMMMMMMMMMMMPMMMMMMPMTMYADNNDDNNT